MAMSAKKPAADDKKPTAVVANNSDDRQGTLKHIGGSQSDHWNNILADQTVQTLWLKNSDEDARNRQYAAAAAGLAGIGPQDELEGMIAAQLLAAHNAAMECYRRAMFGEQTFEGRRENLNQANKLSRTYATLLEALNRHRGKGQQKVTVEHVHVHEGGQAIVGNVESRGEGSQRNQRINPMQDCPCTAAPRCGARTRRGSPCQSPAMPNGRCRMHGGTSPGAPKGNKNAFKHGRYTAEATRPGLDNPSGAVWICVNIQQRLCDTGNHTKDLPSLPIGADPKNDLVPINDAFLECEALFVR